MIYNVSIPLRTHLSHIFAKAANRSSLCSTVFDVEYNSGYAVKSSKCWMEAKPVNSQKTAYIITTHFVSKKSNIHCSQIRNEFYFFTERDNTEKPRIYTKAEAIARIQEFNAETENKANPPALHHSISKASHQPFIHLAPIAA